MVWRKLTEYLSEPRVLCRPRSIVSVTTRQQLQRVETYLLSYMMRTCSRARSSRATLFKHAMAVHATFITALEALEEGPPSSRTEPKTWRMPGENIQKWGQNRPMRLLGPGMLH